MQKKVLVTGLGIGQKLGACPACNLDFTWLYTNPSVLLWADKICIPKDLFEREIIMNEDKLDIAIAIILNELYSNGIIELIDLPDFEETGLVPKSLNIQMDKDLHSMAELFPESVHIDSEADDPLNISIQNMKYCIPIILSIYASLYFASEIEANCLFNERDYAYLKHKLGLDYSRVSNRQIIDAYGEIFSSSLPVESILPCYSLTKESQCENCIHKTKCSTSFEHETKRSLKTILDWRDYDEIHVLRDLIGNIIEKQVSYGDDVSITELKRSLATKQRTVTHNIRKRFPKIKRWANTATILSAPATVVSAATGNIPATIAAASLTTMAEATRKFLELYESRNKWIAFLDKETTLIK